MCHGLLNKYIDSLVHSYRSRKKCWFFKRHYLHHVTMLCLQLPHSNATTGNTYQEIKIPKIYSSGVEHLLSTHEAQGQYRNNLRKTGAEERGREGRREEERRGGEGKGGEEGVEGKGGRGEKSRGRKKEKDNKKGQERLCVSSYLGCS